MSAKILASSRTGSLNQGSLISLRRQNGSTISNSSVEVVYFITGKSKANIEVNKSKSSCCTFSASLMLKYYNLNCTIRLFSEII